MENFYVDIRIYQISEVVVTGEWKVNKEIDIDFFPLKKTHKKNSIQPFFQKCWPNRTSCKITWSDMYEKAIFVVGLAGKWIESEWF